MSTKAVRKKVSRISKKRSRSGKRKASSKPELLGIWDFSISKRLGSQKASISIAEVTGQNALSEITRMTEFLNQTDSSKKIIYETSFDPMMVSVTAMDFTSY